MANDYNRNLFGRLTKLFRSGPVVRRRVKGMNQKTGTASTALEVFRAAHSDVYNSTLSSYGAFDRMSRYSDFCLVGDTYIAVNHPDTRKKISDIVEDYQSGALDYGVFSMHDGEVRHGIIENAWCTGEREIWEVELDNGNIVQCTDNHPFMLRNGEYCRADQLVVGAALMPYKRLKNNRNFVPVDNRYENLCVMPAAEHLASPARINNKRFEIKKNPPGAGNAIRKDQKGTWNANANKQRVLQSIYSAYVPGMDIEQLALKLDAPSPKHIVNRLKWGGYETWESFVTTYSNHKVAAVRKTDRVEKVYDITVKDYHNFALTDCHGNGTVFVHNSEMEACIAGDTLIATPDGYVEIQELAKRYGPDETFIVYSYDHEKKQIVPALGKQARKTVTEMSFKVTFDSGKVLIATPDHRVMRRDGTYCEVQDLKPGDSMMPFYRRDLFADKKSEETSDGYRWIYTMNYEGSTVKNGWVTEHRLIAEWVSERKINPGEVVHHVNFKKWDNRPENLQIMLAEDHRNYHAKIINGKKWSEGNSEWIERFKQRHSEFMKENNPAKRSDITFAKILQICDRDGFNLYNVSRVLDCDYRVIGRRLSENGFDSFTTFAKAYDPEWRNNGWDNREDKNPRYDSSLTFQKICDAFRGQTSRALSEELNTTQIKILNRIKAAGYQSWSDFRENFANHKVVSVEPHDIIDLYDLTVNGYKNYATDSIIVHNTPEIASALDIYAEETAAQGTDGRILHIHSDNRKIQELLEDLFYDTINVEFNLPMWVRNLVKYGDFFLFNDISPDFGVLNCIPISISEIEREEGFDPSDPMAVRYRWITQGNRVLENWQVTHFRLLGNDAFLPYGSSVLEGARRIWRQLILIEDAMLVYRVIRAPERRVFYIDVGNVPPEEISNYLEQAQSSLKRNEVVDKNTGRVDLRFNPMAVDQDYFLPVRGGESGTKIDTLAGGQNTAAIEDVQYIQKKLFAALKIPKAYLGYDEETGCFTGDTRVSLLDGREVEIERLVEEHEAGKQNWVHSCDPATGRIVPGRIVTAWKTKDVISLVEVTVDTGDVLRCTDNHPFLLRDGTYVRADQLVHGQSLMPLRKRLTQSKKFGGEDLLDGYEQIFDNSDNEWKYTHKVVSDLEFGSDPNRIRRSRVVHHIDFNKRNNEPTNLVEMTWSDHRRLHSEWAAETLQRPDVVAKREPNRIAALRSEKHRELKRNQLRSQHSDPGSLMSQWVHSDDLRRSVSKSVSASWQRPEYRKRIQESSRGLWEKEDYRARYTGDNHWSRKAKSEFDIAWLRNFCIEHHVTSINQWRTDSDRSVWDISPVGIRYVNNLIRREGFKGWRDFKRSVAYNHKVLSVRRIELDSPVPVFDLEIENWHNFAVVLGGVHTQNDSRSEILGENVHSTPSDAVFVHNSKATLAQEDIRFSRSIQRIQKTVLAELNKLAMIHLYSHGYEGEDLMDFTLKLSNPSSIAQQQKLELISTKFDIAGKAPEGLVSRRWIRKNILELTDQEIEMLKDERKDDKVEDTEVEAAGTAESPEGGEEGGGEEGGESPVGDLFAGDRPDGDLLLAAPGPGGDESDEPDEDAEEEEFVPPSIDDPDAPIKIDNRIQRTGRQVNMFGEPIKRFRKQTRGPASTGLHDFAKMTGLGNTQSTLRDPYQKNWIKNPLGVGEGLESDQDPLSVAPSRHFAHSLGQVKNFRRPGILREAGSSSDRDIDVLEVDLNSLRSDLGDE